MIVWGCDPSTTRIGIVTGTGEVLSIVSHAGAEDPVRRLYELRNEFVRVVRLRPPRPDLFVFEAYAAGGPAGNLSKFRSGEIGGALRLAVFEMNVAQVDVIGSNVKRFATGNGNADKPQMVARAIELGAPETINHDEADAWHCRRLALAAHGIGGPFLPHELDALEHTGVAW